MEKGLILVGAGPGDPELLTIKGLKAIERAEVILYDALVSEQLLSYAPHGCKCIFVGKRAGMHSMAQNVINSLILKYAPNHLVIRLKGGDPFVFGRGYEEIAIAAEHGISCEIIPGVSSAIAGPAAAGIPVTIRDVNRSFWVVTGTTTEDDFNDDLALACQSSATIIVLMGLGKLEKIASIVQAHRGFSEPMAVIQDATLTRQHVIIGNSSTLSEKCQGQLRNGPGIIVIGKVIDHRIATQWKADQILENTIAA